jgi:hypothetical protein|tara:strand:+ start:662 stop:910 length:249 start_codon:yes stop_codon:yes gene_type:complete
MTDYTITLTDIEVKSLEYSVNGILGWIENAAKNRARIAKNEIIALNTEYCNANNIAIDVGEEAQVIQAYALGVVKTAKERNT